MLFYTLVHATCLRPLSHAHTAHEMTAAAAIKKTIKRGCLEILIGAQSCSGKLFLVVGKLFRGRIRAIDSVNLIIRETPVTAAHSIVFSDALFYRILIISKFPYYSAASALDRFFDRLSWPSEPPS